MSQQHSLKKREKINFVDLKRQYQSIQTEVDTAIADCLQNTAFIGGEAVQKFADAFAQFCGAKCCIPCANGTDALEIALQAFGIKAGDEVIVPVNSFIATAEAVSNCGGTVVFCDCDATSYNIDTQAIERLITPKTKAIIPVHLYGRMADMDPIMALAKKYNLWVLEDAAQAHGATYKGKKAGSFGHFSTFSFYPGKNLGAYGDAGAMVTNDEKLYLLGKKIANHGRIAKYDHDMIGRNSRMDGLQAAVLNVKLPHLAGWNAKRQQIAQYYHKALQKLNLPTLTMPTDEAHENSVYHLYVIRVAASDRDDLRTFLGEHNIATGIHYPIALHCLEAYRFLGHEAEDFPLANQYMGEILSLPIFAELTLEEAQYVVDTIQAFYQEK